MAELDISANSVQLDCSVDSGICVEGVTKDLKKNIQEFKRILFILERDKEAMRLLRERLSRTAERKIVKKKKDGQSVCNVCFTQIDTDDSKTCIACCSCAKNICRGEKCSEWVQKDGEWRCQLCAARRDSYGKASTWVQEQYAVKRASLTEFSYPMRARSEIYIPLCDPNESAFLCNFESVSEVPSPINPSQKQHIREYIEEVLAEMIGGSLENATVEPISTNNMEYQQVRNGNELQGISNVRLRRLIESVIAETIRQPPFASAGLITTTAIDSSDNDNNRGTLPLNGNHCNGNGGQYFESKKYHDLLATAVLNKIVNVHGNGRHSESSPDLTSSSILDNNHNTLNLNKTEESISSSSSVEPRSESSLTDPIRSINKDDDNYGNFYDDVANDNIEVDKESVLSDFISSHMVPLPHISADSASEEDEDEEDFISVASSRDANWEDNWLFKKKKSNKTSSSVGMLVPAPKEDIRALIGDKPTDEVSDLSEVGSDTDDSSLEMVSASLEPLNDRLVNKHLIGGKNTKIVLDEIVDRTSMISTSSLPDDVPPYTETKNEFVVSNDGLNESEPLKISVNNCNKAIGNEAINSNVTKTIPTKAEKKSQVTEDESIVPPPNDFTDDEKMRNLLAKFNEEQNNKTDSGDDNSSSLSPRSSISCALSEVPTLDNELVENATESKTPEKVKVGHHTIEEEIPKEDDTELVDKQSEDIQGSKLQKAPSSEEQIESAVVERIEQPECQVKNLEVRANTLEVLSSHCEQNLTEQNVEAEDFAKQDPRNNYAEEYGISSVKDTNDENAIEQTESSSDAKLQSQETNPEKIQIEITKETSEAEPVFNETNTCDASKPSEDPITQEAGKEVEDTKLDKTSFEEPSSTIAENIVENPKSEESVIAPKNETISTEEADETSTSNSEVEETVIEQSYNQIQSAIEIESPNKPISAPTKPDEISEIPISQVEDAKKDKSSEEIDTEKSNLVINESIAESQKADPAPKEENTESVIEHLQIKSRTSKEIFEPVTKVESETTELTAKAVKTTEEETSENLICAKTETEEVCEPQETEEILSEVSHETSIIESEQEDKTLKTDDLEHDVETLISEEPIPTSEEKGNQKVQKIEPDEVPAENNENIEVHPENEENSSLLAETIIERVSEPNIESSISIGVENQSINTDFPIEEKIKEREASEVLKDIADDLKSQETSPKDETILAEETICTEKESNKEILSEEKVEECNSQGPAADSLDQKLSSELLVQEEKLNDDKKVHEEEKSNEAITHFEEASKPTGKSEEREIKEITPEVTLEEARSLVLPTDFNETPLATKVVAKLDKTNSESTSNSQNIQNILKEDIIITKTIPDEEKAELSTHEVTKAVESEEVCVVAGSSKEDILDSLAPKPDSENVKDAPIPKPEVQKKTEKEVKLESQYAVLDVSGLNLKADDEKINSTLNESDSILKTGDEKIEGMPLIEPSLIEDAIEDQKPEIMSSTSSNTQESVPIKDEQDGEKEKVSNENLDSSQTSTTEFNNETMKANESEFQKPTDKTEDTVQVKDAEQSLTTDSEKINEDKVGSMPFISSEDVTASTLQIPDENFIAAEKTKLEENIEPSKSKESTLISEVTEIFSGKDQSVENEEVKAVLDVAPEIPNADVESKLVPVPTEGLLEEKAIAENEEISLEQNDAVECDKIAEVSEIKDLALQVKLEKNHSEAEVEKKVEAQLSEKLVDTSESQELTLYSKNELDPLDELQARELCESNIAPAQQIGEVISSHELSSCCSKITPKEEAPINQPIATEELKLQEATKVIDNILCDETTTVRDESTKTEEQINVSRPIHIPETDSSLASSTVTYLQENNLVEKESAVKKELISHAHCLKEVPVPNEQIEENSVPEITLSNEVTDELKSLEVTSSEDTEISEKEVLTAEESKTKEVSGNIENILVSDLKGTQKEGSEADSDSAGIETNIEVCNLQDSDTTEKEKPVEIVLATETEDTNILSENETDQTSLRNTISSQDIQPETKPMEQTSVEASHSEQNLSDKIVETQEVQEQMTEVKDETVQTNSDLQSSTDNDIAEPDSSSSYSYKSFQEEVIAENQATPFEKQPEPTNLKESEASEDIATKESLEGNTMPVEEENQASELSHNEAIVAEEITLISQKLDKPKDESKPSELSTDSKDVTESVIVLQFEEISSNDEKLSNVIDNLKSEEPLTTLSDDTNKVEVYVIPESVDSQNTCMNAIDEQVPAEPDNIEKLFSIEAIKTEDTIEPVPDSKHTQVKVEEIQNQETTEIEATPSDKSQDHILTENSECIPGTVLQTLNEAESNATVLMLEIPKSQEIISSDVKDRSVHSKLDTDAIKVLKPVEVNQAEETVNSEANAEEVTAEKTIQKLKSQNSLTSSENTPETFKAVNLEQIESVQVEKVILESKKINPTPASEFINTSDLPVEEQTNIEEKNYKIVEAKKEEESDELLLIPTEMREEVPEDIQVQRDSTVIISEPSKSLETIPTKDNLEFKSTVQSESQQKKSSDETLTSEIETLQKESNKISAETTMAESTVPIQNIDGAQTASKTILASEITEPTKVDNNDEEVRFQEPSDSSEEQIPKSVSPGVAMAEDKLCEVITEQDSEVEEMPPIEVLTATCKIITHPPLQPTESLIESAQYLYDNISDPILETTCDKSAPNLAEELKVAADRDGSKDSSNAERVIPQNIPCESRCFTADPQPDQPIASDSVATEQPNAHDAFQGKHISQIAKQHLFAEQSARKSKSKNSGSKFRNLTIRDRRFLAELEKRRKQRELIQNYLDSLDSIDTPSYLNEDLYLFESKCSIERSPYSLFIEPSDYCIVDATSTSPTAKTHFLKTNILFSDRISSESNCTDDSTTTVIDTFGSMESQSNSDSGEEFSPDGSTDRDSSATATTANNSIVTTNKATNQSHIYSPPPQPQPELRTESACSKLLETRTTGGNEEHVDDDPLKHLVPGSIAEREYKKWYNAVDMPNNPYSVEALRRRLSGGHDRALDLPNISPCNEENPLQLCESPVTEVDNKGQERDYSRYSRDYYINDAKQASGTTKKSPTSPPQVSSPTSTASSIELGERVENNSKNVETTPVRELCHKLEKQCRVEADIYLATPVHVIEDIPQAFADKNPIKAVGTITSLTSEAVSKLSSETSSTLTNESLTPSEDSDTIRIYDLKKQETRLIKESFQTTTITVPKSPEKKVRPTELDIMPTLAPPTATVSSKCSTPTSFKFLQPKRKLISPSQVLSIDLDTTPITPSAPEKPVIEAEVAHALPSVKALAKAFLLTTSTASSENKWRKARAKAPLQFFKPTTPTAATAAANISKVIQKQPEPVVPDTTSQGSEDATIASDLSSLETDPPSAIEGETLDSNATEDRALSSVVLSGCLRNNIAFFENLKNK